MFTHKSAELFKLWATANGQQVPLSSPAKEAFRRKGSDGRTAKTIRKHPTATNPSLGSSPQRTWFHWRSFQVARIKGAPA